MIIITIFIALLTLSVTGITASPEAVIGGGYGRWRDGDCYAGDVQRLGEALLRLTELMYRRDLM